MVCAVNRHDDNVNKKLTDTEIQMSNPHDQDPQSNAMVRIGGAPFSVIEGLETTAGPPHSKVSMIMTGWSHQHRRVLRPPQQEHHKTKPKTGRLKQAARGLISRWPTMTAHLVLSAVQNLIRVTPWRNLEKHTYLQT